MNKCLYRMGFYYGMDIYIYYDGYAIFISSASGQRLLSRLSPFEFMARLYL